MENIVIILNRFEIANWRNYVRELNSSVSTLPGYYHLTIPKDFLPVILYWANYPLSTLWFFDHCCERWDSEVETSSLLRNSGEASLWKPHFPSYICTKKWKWTQTLKTNQMILMIRTLLLMKLNDSLIKVLRKFTAYMESMKCAKSLKSQW